MSFRTEHINEQYYHINNHPSFYQFGRDYDFADNKGRKYRIAEKNKNTFQNTKFKPKNTLKDKSKTKKAFVNTYGYIKMFIKLNQDAEWYTRKDIDKILILVNRKTKEQVNVKLKSFFKSDHKRRTGEIFVSGLSEIKCNEILNE